MTSPSGPWRDRIVGHGYEDPANLVAHPLNWRVHTRTQRAAMRGALNDVGWVDEVIVNRRTGHTLNGHLREEIAVERGEISIPVSYVDLSDDEEALVLATFDPIGAMAGSDGKVLEALLAQVTSADAAVQELLADIARSAQVDINRPAEGRTDPDDAPSLAVSVSRPGDRWLLDGHRLECGDSTDLALVRALFGAETAAWAWTDPPWGVGYVGADPSLVIRHDTAAEVPQLLAAAFRAADAVLMEGAPIYVAHPTGPLAVTFWNAFTGAGWHGHQDLVWVKDSVVPGHSDYSYRHEGILYGWKGKNRFWFAARDCDSVFEVPRPKRSADHPTMKPVALIEAHLRNSSARCGLGFDPFAGSGSTILAAERLGRRCFAMEIDERYVDVAVRRWQDFTGHAARLQADGGTFAEIEEDRHGR